MKRLVICSILSRMASVPPAHAVDIVIYSKKVNWVYSERVERHWKMDGRKSFRPPPILVSSRLVSQGVTRQHFESGQSFTVSRQSPIQPVLFAVAPSLRLQYALIAAHGLALGACLSNALPWPGKLLLGLALLIHLGFAVRDVNHRRDAIRYHAASGWNINDEAVLILPSTVVTPFAVWLHFKPEGARKKAILIVNDALPEHEFRRLIVKLKISAA